MAPHRSASEVGARSWSGWRGGVRSRQQEVAQSLDIDILEESHHSPIMRKNKKGKGFLHGIIRYWQRIRMGTGLQVCVCVCATMRVCVRLLCVFLRAEMYVLVC